MAARSPRFIANSSINPSNIVVIDSSNDFMVNTSTGLTQSPVGVCDEATKYPPGVLGSDGYAAHQYEPLKVYGAGEECLLVASAAITRGNWVGSGSTSAAGQGLAIAFTLGSSTIYAVGFALESAAAGSVLIRIIVLPTPIPGCTA